MARANTNKSTSAKLQPAPAPAVSRRAGATRARDAEGNPNAVDSHVGHRVRLRRTLMGMSQERLGELIGLTFQQVQKYERGANRISASRLFDIARVLEVPVSFFFDDMPASVSAASPAQRALGATPAEPVDTADQMTKRETLELVRHYYAIPDEAVRQRLYLLAKQLAKAADGVSAD